MIDLTAKVTDKLNDHTAIPHHRLCGDGEDGQQHSAFHRNAGNGEQVADKEDTDQHSCRTADQDSCSQQIEWLAYPIQDHKTYNSQKQSRRSGNIR